jgi:8-oxo-dGTP pyrophosphatase MutT (NUDIX family)
MNSMTDFFLGGEGRLRPEDAVVALILVDSERYLMQLRDRKPGIFYPDHWGLFGGAIDSNETAESALKRELDEELGLSVDESRYFTEFTFDFSFSGYGRVLRRYFEIAIDQSKLGGLVLGEGAEMRAFSPGEILSVARVVPYDAFAIWLHATQRPARPS